jgi:hypothetical protein
MKFPDLKIDENYTSSIMSLHEKNLVDALNPLWWDVNYVDERKPLDFSTFKNKIRDTSIDDVVIFQEDNVPITIAEINLEGVLVKLLITVRPFTPKEIEKYFYQVHEKNPFLEVDANLSDYRQKLKELQLSNAWELPIMFTPHIRGVFFETINENNTFVYSPFKLSTKNKYSGKKNMNKKLISSLKKALHKEKLDFINVFDYPIMFNDRLKRTFEYLQYDEIITTKKDKGRVCKNNPDLKEKFVQMNEKDFLSKEILLKNATQIPYFQILQYLEEKNPFFAYFPLQLRTSFDSPLTIPFLVTNAYSEFKNIPAILGVYSSSKRINNDSLITVLPVQDPQFVLDASFQARKYLQKDVLGLFLKRQTARSYLKVPDKVKDVDVFSKYAKNNYEWQ